MPLQQLRELHLNLVDPLGAEPDRSYNIAGCVPQPLEEFETLTMHRTHPTTHGLVSSEESVQQDRATGNHHHRSKDEANSADDRVDCHSFSFYGETPILWF